MGFGIAPALVLVGELSQAFAQRFIAGPAHDRTTLGGAMLADDPASPPFRHLEAVLEHHDRVAPARRAQKFPLATSFSASISSSLSATMRLSRVFSFFSSFSRLASSALSPPNWFLHR